MRSTRPWRIPRLNIRTAKSTGSTNGCRPRLPAGGQLAVRNCRYLLKPTVLLNPPADANVSMEIFGPVICVYAYDDIDEAIEQRTLAGSFQAAVMTKDIDTAMRVTMDRRNGSYGERAHGLPRRLDAVRRCPSVGPRCRRHSVHNA